MKSLRNYKQRLIKSDNQIENKVLN